jgi:hypothetical protein
VGGKKSIHWGAVNKNCFVLFSPDIRQNAEHKARKKIIQIICCVNNLFVTPSRCVKARVILFCVCRLETGICLGSSEASRQENPPS